MLNVYFHPKFDFKITASPNPYIFNLENSLAQKYNIINKNYNKKGVLDFFNYLFKADIYLFNWIENLSERRYGGIQVIFFCLFLIAAKCLRKKIVWILHNKYSHNISRSKWVDIMYYIMLKHSDLILTHSKSGINFVKERNPLYSKKVKYFMHPINPIFPTLSHSDCIYDFLIWGTIQPYKGIVDFLKYLKDTGKIHFFKILIIGRCLDYQYKKEVDKYLAINIIHLDEYYEIREIANFANQAKFTLFTYKPESLLSSGSLMDSIGMGSAIIGPNIGAFKDLSSYHFINTYSTYDKIIDIYNTYNSNKDSRLKEIDNFCHENSWELFSEKLCKEINKII